MLPLIRSRLPLADTQTLIDYAKLVADQYETLGLADAQVCYAFAARGESGKALQLLGADLKQREVRLSERILSATPTRRPTASQRDLEALYRKVFNRLVARHGEADVGVLLDPAKVRPAQYLSYCRMAAAMFKEFTQLPAAEAETVLSALFKELSGPDPK